MRFYQLSLIAMLCALPTLAAGGVSRIIPGTDLTTTDARSRLATRSDDVTESLSERAARNLTQSRGSITPTRVVSTRNVPALESDSTRTSTRTTIARSHTTSDNARSKLSEAVRNVGRSKRTSASSINSNPAVRRAGVTLRPSTAEVGGRAKLASGEQTGSNIASEIRNLQPRATTTVKMDAGAIADAKERLEQAAALNKSCQEQYNDCMDQFCAVIDANQKRCSCSANLSKYTKAEAAVKEANTKLNEVAQSIRYVGLSADEISAIMSATEAEEALAGKTDTTESRSMLAEIEKMIINPASTSSDYSATSDSYSLLDINLDFSSSDISDLFSLDFLDGGNSSSFSSLRGTNLYNAAEKRCKLVIDQCKEVGATSDQITGNYDLAIDKDCIAYEQGLTKMNETLISNVRSATRMLQKARLAVLQSQNAYDARGCVSALEKCMTDDMVCGEGYVKCLDPTKMFINENGEVVLGKNINNIQAFVSNYINANVDKTVLANAYGITIGIDKCSDGDGLCIIKYLLGKIGTKQKATDEGLCRPVLDKCRAYTYDSRGNYTAYNDIVINFIQRAMVNIKAAQYKIISDYSSSCLSDVADCYNDQNAQLTSWASTASASSIYSVMRGACRNVALTCGYAIFADDPESCPTGDNVADQIACIDSVSSVFYQQLLCPENSVYQMGGYPTGPDANNTAGGWVNSRCKCISDYVTYNGSCLPECASGLAYVSTARCMVSANIGQEESTSSSSGSAEYGSGGSGSGASGEESGSQTEEQSSRTET